METAFLVVSLVLAVVSVVLGAGAIWLSLVLYRFSDGTLHEVQSIAGRVEQSVGILEQRVHGLHEDTFSLVRETVADMRGALWTRNPGGDEGSARIEKDLERELQGIRGEFIQMLDRLDVDRPADPGRLEGEVDLLLRRSADAGRSARQAVVKRYVLEALDGKRDGLPAADVMASLARDFPFSVVMACLHELLDDRIVVADRAELGPATRLSLQSAA